MQISKDEYSKAAQSAYRKSRPWVNVPKAFLTGGMICAAGELICEFFKAAGVPSEDASAFTSVTLIIFSAVLTGVSLYPKVAKHGGAGTLVPITGFANAVVSPAVEFRSEGWILGVGAKVFAIAGPVILYGTAAGVLWGVIYFVINSLKL